HEDALRIRVDVRDDIHVQKETAVNLWRADSIQLAFQLPGEKAYWEIGAAQTDTGETLRVAWITPPGFKDAEKLFDVTCAGMDGGLRYEFTLPCARFGLTKQSLERGLRFNLIVNDNDGKLREQFIRIAPGIGESKDPSAFPVIHFQAQTPP
ncbi:MAG TPA: 1,4-beta-xylanase, partial [Candidatus Hydrogenedentes bacterium]|nr:1,4-beta-xylanase [Candidatus Hydrogenedentota bacterium]